MAVDLTTNGVGLFRRLGRNFGLIGAENLNRGTTTGASVDLIRDQYLTSRSDLINSLYQIRDDFRTTPAGFLTALVSIGSSTLQQMVNDDTKLASVTLGTAMTELIRQMVLTSDSVDANAVTATVAVVAGNTGNAICTASVLDGYGKKLEYSFAEVVKVQCTSDSKTGAATVFQETFTATGTAAQTNKLSWDWPKGSAASKTVTVVDQSQNNSLNKLTNSDFEDFTVANTPDNWSLLVGSIGTHVFSTATSYKGSKALLITGDASNLTSIAQTMNVGSGGTAGTLQPNTVYAWNFFGRKTTSLAAGVLSVELVDGSNTVINDDAGTANASAFTLSGWTTSYAAKNGYFRTPKVLPASGYKVRLRLTTAITNTESIYIDDLALVAATQLYTAGPYIAVFGGDTASLLADKYTVTIANDYGGLFQTYFWRAFDMPSLALILPSDAGGSETVVDTLVSAV